ncbi:hypothetical protein CVT24_013139 [Panaeolus cyanescens]|uniref:Uncharacterized protein n=1 Tax=Panaeolus cyanescens TaxID=181874 RepID=A0A409VVW9_9AGAR|nr:hypothetical protein CVT24_013139 [Panaeolus cyanescens]
MDQSESPRVLECDARIARLQAEIRAIQTLRNSYQPISRLPPELLCRVFVHVRDTVSSFPRRHYYIANAIPSWVRPITHICRQWRDTALSCPELWSRLEFDSYPPSWMELQLSRAKEAALSVSFASQPDKYEKPLLAALQNPARLQSLRILGATCEIVNKYVKNLRGAYLPLLQRFQFNGISCKTHQHLSIDLFSGGTPLLQELDLHVNEALPLNSPIFKNLTILKLKTLESAPMILDNLLNALDNSPTLHVLDVEFSFPDVPLSTSRSQAVILPNLETFHFSSSFANCVAILRNLRIPTKAQMDIVLTHHAYGNPHIAPTDVPSDAESLLSTMQRAFLPDPLSSNQGPVQESLPIKSLTYHQHEEIYGVSTITLMAWLDDREFTSLHDLAPDRNRPHLRLHSPSNAHVANPVFNDIPLVHIKSASIRGDNKLVWNTLRRATSLTSLCVDGASASIFFKHAMLVVKGNTSTAGDKSKKKGPSAARAKKEKQVVSVGSFPNLANLSFIGVDFGHSMYDNPADCDDMPINFEKQFMRYLKLRRQYAKPIKRLLFTTCINFTDKEFGDVKKVVSDVDWDKDVEFRDDEYYMEDEDDDDENFCEFCGEEDCYDCGSDAYYGF